MLQRTRKRKKPPIVVVCLRECTALPELVHEKALEPLSPRITYLIARHSGCRAIHYEGACAHAMARLSRHICDCHGRPIMLVPEGTFPRDGAQAS